MPARSSAVPASAWTAFTSRMRARMPVRVATVRVTSVRAASRASDFTARVSMRSALTVSTITAWLRRSLWRWASTSTSAPKPSSSRPDT